MAIERSDKERRLNYTIQSFFRQLLGVNLSVVMCEAKVSRVLSCLKSVDFCNVYYALDSP